MRKAFTLIELLVVVGIMGMMSTIAVASYSAVTRGMSDRAALDAARSIVDAALQRANLDRTRVYLYLFNDVTQLDTATSAGRACGLAVAVRPVGRITHVPETGKFFCDEFGDLNQTFAALEEEDEQAGENEREKSASTLRLYNVADETYATVREGVFAFDVRDADLEDAAAVQREWQVYGFKKVSGEATFEVGDAYGQEFAVTRLPPGYTFSSSVNMGGTADLGQRQVKIVRIDPAQSSTQSINVFARRPNGMFEDIGNVIGKQNRDGEE